MLWVKVVIVGKNYLHDEQIQLKHKLNYQTFPFV